MAIRIAQKFLGRIFTQRCFYLFVVLLAFDVAVPFLESGREGRFLIAVLNCFVIVCAVAAVGQRPMDLPVHPGTSLRRAGENPAR